MKKLILIVVSIMILTGCGIDFYNRSKTAHAKITLVSGDIIDSDITSAGVSAYFGQEAKYLTIDMPNGGTMKISVKEIKEFTIVFKIK